MVDVYDDVIIPAMSLAEEGRHAGFLIRQPKSISWRTRESWSTKSDLGQTQPRQKIAVLPK